jgi:hypothetical protein
VIGCVGNAGMIDDGPHQALVMQFYARGSLSRALTSLWFERLTTVERLKIAHQVGRTCWTVGAMCAGSADYRAACKRALGASD